MGRTRKPVGVLELTGAFGKNPQRRRAPEPKGQGALGDPPPHLSDEQRQAWLELADQGHWLTGSDRLAVEVAAGLLVRVRTDPAFRGHGHLLSALGKLGLSPADRSKVEVVPPKRAASKWAALDDL